MLLMSVKILIDSASDLNKEEAKKMKSKARETAIKYDSINTKNILVEVFK